MGGYGKHTHVVKPLRIIGKRYIFLGDRVSILNGARMEALHDDWNNESYHGEIHVGEGTTIEQDLHIISAEKVLIGQNCMISSRVFISDCNHGLLPNKRFQEQPLTTKMTVIGNHVFIGTGAVIMAGIKIGDFSVIGANAVVTHDIPERTIAAGVPARTIGKVSDRTTL